MTKADLTHYKTAHALTPEALDDVVQELIRDGWWVYGNPYMFRLRCCQAMVKHFTNEEVPE